MEETRHTELHIVPYREVSISQLQFLYRFMEDRKLENIVLA